MFYRKNNYIGNKRLQSIIVHRDKDECLLHAIIIICVLWRYKLTIFFLSNKIRILMKIIFVKKLMYLNKNSNKKFLLVIYGCTQKVLTNYHNSPCLSIYKFYYRLDLLSLISSYIKLNNSKTTRSNLNLDITFEKKSFGYNNKH